MAFAGSMLAHQAECCPCGSSFSLAHVFNDYCRTDRLEPMNLDLSLLPQRAIMPSLPESVPSFVMELCYLMSNLYMQYGHYPFKYHVLLLFVL